MVTAAFIVGLILLFFIFLTFYKCGEEDSTFSDGLSLGIVVMLSLCLESVLVYCILYKPTPTAMDVYQGKTTLEYKVVDDIKVDSVVIFKNSDCGISNRNCCTDKPNPAGN